MLEITEKLIAGDEHHSGPEAELNVKNPAGGRGKGGNLHFIKQADGLASWRVELVLGLDEINRSDLCATPTHTVRQLTGHPPRTVEEYSNTTAQPFPDLERPQQLR